MQVTFKGSSPTAVIFANISGSTGDRRETTEFSNTMA